MIVWLVQKLWARIMKLDDLLIKNSEVNSESSDLENSCNTSYSARISSNNSSLLSDLGNGTEIEDNDYVIGGAGSINQKSLDSLDTPKRETNNDVRKEIRRAETQTTENYDREAILQELANFRDSSVLNYVLKMERMRKDAKKSSINSEGVVETQTPKNKGERCPQSEFQEFREALQAVPDWMLHLLTGSDRSGDHGRPSDHKPDWLDVKKLQRGQKFVQDYIFPIFCAEALSLFALFSFDDALRPLIFTRKTSTPYVAFKRIFSGALKQRNWYTHDLWAKDSAAWKDISMVRAMHTAVRRKMDGLTDEELNARTKIPDPWCPSREILRKDFSDNETCEIPDFFQCPYMASRNNSSRVKNINQTDMVITQWSFIGLIVCYPKNFGLHYVSDEDLDAYCHYWRNIGYQLGIEDEFNFCRGTLEDIRQRSSDVNNMWIKPNLLAITPEWEHIMRCLISGSGVILPVSCNLYEIALLYLTEILSLKMPRLYASLSFKDWILYNVLKSLFDYLIKIPGMLRLFNYWMNSTLDRFAKFTPEELEAIKINLSERFGSHAKAS